MASFLVFPYSLSNSNNYPWQYIPSAIIFFLITYCTFSASEHYTMAGKARSDVIISDSDYEASSDDRASDCGSYVDETDSADDEPKTQSGSFSTRRRRGQSTYEVMVEEKF